MSLPHVYFVLKRAGGCGLIKIGATAECPFLRLDQLRCAERKKNRYARFELIGWLDDPATKKTSVQKQFSTLREGGDWFRPGGELIEYVCQHSKPHICNQACPDGTLVYEEWRASQEAASAAMQKGIQ